MFKRIDIAALKRDHPITEVVSRFGIDVRPSGRALVGRCPFHPDHGRPNFHVYSATESWYCFRCAEGGDVIRFVERIAGVSFREAVELLDGPSTLCHVSPPRSFRAAKPRSRPAPVHGSAERACLAAAVDVYHNRLLADTRALGYVECRGIDRTTFEGCRLGFAAGDELVAYLRWLRLPVQAAVRVGLLGRDGREFLAGRVVAPEIRVGQPLWLVGRTIDPRDVRPKYLGLPGRKPLFGWEFAASHHDVWVVEGIFDFLTLRSWGMPALALVGTQVRPETLAALERFRRIYLALDNDPAGRDASRRLADHLGDRAIPVSLPGVKDVADLAVRQNGREILVRALDITPLAA